jgi:hypothetical protein
MGLRITILSSILAAAGSALLLNAVDANPAIAVVVYALVAVISGLAIAVFGTQIPEPSRWLPDVSRGKAHKS